VVDHILAKCNASSIPDFLKAVFGPSSTQKKPPADQVEGSLLYLTPDDQGTLESLKVYPGPRVGLSLKKVRDGIDVFVMKHHRFLTRPAKITKGKMHLALSLHQRFGMTGEEVAQVMKTAKATIKNYLEYMEHGRDMEVSSFYGSALSTTSICQLYGALVAHTKHLAF